MAVPARCSLCAKTSHDLDPSRVDDRCDALGVSGVDVGPDGAEHRTTGALRWRRIRPAAYTGAVGETSDRELVERWRGGDEAAQEALISRHYPAMQRFFAGKLPAAASDLTQQTFLACLEAADRLENAASFRAFLYGVARYVLLRYLRSEGQRAPVESYTTRPGETTTPTWPRSPFVGDSSPVCREKQTTTEGSIPSGLVCGHASQSMNRGSTSNATVEAAAAMVPLPASGPPRLLVLRRRGVPLRRAGHAGLDTAKTGLNRDAAGRAQAKPSR